MDNQAPTSEPRAYTPPAMAPPVLPYPPVYPQPPGVPQKTPILAGILSAFIPGLGNIYNGLYLRGFSFFLIHVVLFSLAVSSEGDGDTAFLVPCLVFFWFFNIFDAYRQASFINYGYASDTPEIRNGRPLPSGIVPGVILFGLGIYGILREYFRIDFSWVLDHWPLLLLLIGAGLIGQAVWAAQKAKQRPQASRYEEEAEV